MLQEDGRQSWHDGRVFLLYAEVGEEIAILRLDDVLLDWIVEVLAVVHEGQLGFRVLLGKGYNEAGYKNSHHKRSHNNNIIRQRVRWGLSHDDR